ncbi:MAG: insulinase family protein [Cellvibrionales bacterium]|nr:insulinase family protein [Cellvibrionales bacterium]
MPPARNPHLNHPESPVPSSAPFEPVRHRAIPSLNLQVEEYRHRATGAQHVHIAADNRENVFLVALRTVPQDSSGVAHILEHTALCGSARYPVRDPFFMMLRRSLNTFMNAFTSSDWTAYPFASQNRKDFNNLLDVYLDAVFFPHLHELDFAQEGHRLEFAELANPKSDLQFKGVVHNEMKGAMSSPAALGWYSLCKHLYPTTTYHYNSGGDPAAIPDLTHSQLKEFHRSHYHPSNAIFMTFGDIPAADHQTIFEDRVLRHFNRLDKPISVPLERRHPAPIQATEPYPIAADENPANKTQIIIGWLLGESTDLPTAMRAHLLAAVLLDNSASPLQQALETTDLGRAPSPLCGLSDSQRELCFVCGLEGCADDSAEAVENLILRTLDQVARDGVPQEQMQACLHQLELQQREITGGGYPFGLQLILAALGNATHRGDPAAPLDLEPVIAELREAIKNPRFLPDLCRELLLDNPHRVRLTLRPDPTLAKQTQAEERARLDQIRAALSPEQTQQIIDQSRALQHRQTQVDDPEILPRVGLGDVPADLAAPHPQPPITAALPIHSYAAPTNGIVYQEIAIALPALTQAEIALLPLLTGLWTELGIGDKSYLDVQQWQAAISGGLRCFHKIEPAPNDLAQTHGMLFLSGKALQRNRGALGDLLHATIEDLRIAERDRIREIIAQSRAAAENSVTDNGHALAMLAAAQHASPTAAIAHQTHGLAGIRRLKEWDDRMDRAAALDELLQQLAQLHQKLARAPRQILLISEPAELPSYQTEIKNQNAGQNHAKSNPPSPKSTAANLSPSTPPKNQTTKQLWIANSPINFCARAYPSVPLAHPDAAALTVLGGLLRNNFLHSAIREQGGAYGGGAAQDSRGGTFRFYSYRDPRLRDTLADFDRAIDWALATPPTPRLLEESILGVIGALDKPGSPAGEAKAAHRGDLFGRTRQVKQTFRQRVLATTGPDLQRVARHYLTPENASTAVLTGPHAQTAAAELELETLHL